MFNYHTWFLLQLLHLLLLLLLQLLLLLLLLLLNRRLATFSLLGWRDNSALLNALAFHVYLFSWVSLIFQWKTCHHGRRSGATSQAPIVLFSIRIPWQWNKFSIDIACCNSLSKFKRLLSKHLLYINFVTVTLLIALHNISPYITYRLT